MDGTGDSGNTLFTIGGAVLSGYWLRTRTNYDSGGYSMTYNAWPMHSNLDILPNFRGAIVSDNIGGNWPATTWIDGSTDPYGAADVHTNVFVQNHDRLYNVLFRTGEVRSFSDSGSLLKKLVSEQLFSAIPGPLEGTMCDFLSDQVFPAYFDPLASGER